MMLRKGLVSTAVIGIILCLQEQTPAGQADPHFGSSPPVVPYKPSRSKLPQIKSCPDFQANPEKDVVYKVGIGITPPKPTRLISFGLTEQGKEAYRNNKFPDPNEVISTISVVVDTQGKPRDPCLVRAAGFDLDQQAAEVVMQYRFNAARRAGKTTPMRAQIELRYQTH
jgi:hypothetical protein